MNDAPLLALTAHQLQELRHLATFAGGKHVWVNCETITQVQLVELGLVNEVRLGPLAGGRYKWRFTVSAHGRALLSATAQDAARAGSESERSSREPDAWLDGTEHRNFPK